MVPLWDQIQGWMDSLGVSLGCFRLDQDSLTNTETVGRDSLLDNEFSSIFIQLISVLTHTRFIPTVLKHNQEVPFLFFW